MSETDQATKPERLPKGAYRRPDGELMLPLAPCQAINETAARYLGLIGRTGQ